MSQQPKLYLASDPLGCALREALAAQLQQAHPEFSVQDLGNFDKYYEAAFKVRTHRLAVLRTPADGNTVLSVLPAGWRPCAAVPGARRP
jgi:hypothetical protein